MQNEVPRLVEEAGLTELETEIVKWFVVEALAFSVLERQIDRDKAVDQFVLWFPGDKTALAGLYKQIKALDVASA